MKKLASALMLLAPLFAFSSASVQAQDANAIMEKASQVAYYQGDDGRAQMLMKVYPKGSDQPIKKLFNMLRMDVEENGKQNFLTYFAAPADIKRTTFLVHKSVEEDDFRRLYMPAADKVIAIAGSRKQDPFMGSDFTYEDVSGRHFTKDNHVQVGEEKVDGGLAYVMESTPKNPADDIYSKLKSWIDQETFVVKKVEFYGKDGALLRVYTSASTKTIDGYPTTLKRTMVSPAKGTRTEILVNPKSVKYNIGLTESSFTERALKNPPLAKMK